MKNKAQRSVAILRKKKTVSKQDTAYRRIEVVNIRTLNGIKAVSSKAIDAAWIRIVGFTD